MVTPTDEPDYDFIAYIDEAGDPRIERVAVSPHVLLVGGQDEQSGRELRRGLAGGQFSFGRQAPKMQIAPLADIETAKKISNEIDDFGFALLADEETTENQPLGSSYGVDGAKPRQVAEATGGDGGPVTFTTIYERRPGE